MASSEYQQQSLSWFQRTGRFLGSAMDQAFRSDWPPRAPVRLWRNIGTIPQSRGQLPLTMR
jgi:hypothetical protein